MKTIPPNSRAFTLIELLCTVGIIILLAAIIYPTVTSFKEKGNQTACLSHMREVGKAVLQYSVENNNRLLPCISGENSNMNSVAWYYILDTEGLLPGNPNNPKNAGVGLWGGRRNSIMACPSRPSPPNPYWVIGKHDLHFALNQNPGFLNRVNTKAGGWPTLARIKQPSRTFMLAEASSFSVNPDGQNLAYPHPHRGSDYQNGQGMNLVFYDGHCEYFKGEFPVLPGSSTSVPYDKIKPEDSFPFF